ncbi:MAG: hypothetical protein WA695_01220 [Candidatus Dormiibacterota bacterium]
MSRQPEIKAPGKVDHLRLILEPEYVLQHQRLLSTLEGVNHLTVVHEPKGECCALESWETTRGRLFAPVPPMDQA